MTIHFKLIIKGQMDEKLQEILTALKPWATKHSRKAYKPIVKSTDDMTHHSRFGGTPLLTPETEWPMCGFCEQPMHMFLQLDLATLPVQDLPWDSGLLQFFYCIDWENECNDYEAFSDCHTIRIIKDTENLSIQDIPNFKQKFPAKQITGWTEFLDYPRYDEPDVSGLTLDFDSEWQGTIKLHLDETKIVEFDKLDEEFIEEIFETIEAKNQDKLAGWPHWIQGVEYPNCPICKQPMDYFFQIDSEDNIPYMFGDVGCGHITFCRQHPDVLAFQWACS